MGIIKRKVARRRKRTAKPEILILVQRKIFIALKWFDGFIAEFQAFIIIKDILQINNTAIDKF